MKLEDVPKLIKANYSVHVPWNSVERWMSELESDGIEVDLSPDFQRDHVWTNEQKSRFVEWGLREGSSGMDIYWNCPGWMQHRSKLGPMEIVDGKQRISAVRAFLRGEIPAFGHKLCEYEDKIGPFNPAFTFHVADFPERKTVLGWYLDFNSGGTVHTAEELEKVQRMLHAEMAAERVRKLR